MSLHGGAGEDTLGDGSNGATRLINGQEHTNAKSQQTPCNGQDDPESEVSLGEHPGGEGKEGPEDNKHESEPPAGPHHGLGGLVHGFRAVLSGQLLLIGNTVFLNERNFTGGLPVVVLGLHDGHDGADDGRNDDGSQVTAQHGVVAAQVVDIDGAIVALAGDQPGDEPSDGTDDGAGNGTRGRGLGPGQASVNGEHSTTDGNAHKQINPAQTETDLEEDDGEDTHEATEADDTDTRDTDDVLASGLGVDIGAVDVISKQRRDGHQLRVGSGGDSHENHEAGEPGTGGTEHVDSGGGGDETIAGFTGSQRQVSGTRAETQGGGEGEGNAEPHDTTQQVALPGGRGLGGNGTHVVRLINKHGTEVTDNVNNTEDETTLREHGEERATHVVGDGAKLKVGGGINGGGGGSHRLQVVPHT